MTPVHAALVLLLAVVISTQVLLLTERRPPLRARLQDLGWGGDSLGLLLAATLVVGATGTLIGAFWREPLLGAALGIAATVLTWLTAVTLTSRAGGNSRS